METIELNHLNAALRVSGSEKRRGLKLENLRVKEWPEGGGHLKLLVFDEKDTIIYSQSLERAKEEHASKIEIDKTFHFYEHLTVRLEAEPQESPFAVVLAFE